MLQACALSMEPVAIASSFRTCSTLREGFCWIFLLSRYSFEDNPRTLRLKISSGTFKLTVYFAKAFPRPLWISCASGTAEMEVTVKSRARAAVPFSLEPKRSCANCVWLLSSLRTAALLKRIPFYNTAKQWRTLQKLALTSVDPSNTKFSFPSSLASLRQQQKALALTSPRRAKARVGVNSCKASKACSEQHALLQGCSKASLAYLCSSCAHQGKPKHAKTCHIMPKHATTCQCYKTCRKPNKRYLHSGFTVALVGETLHQNTRTPQEESSRISYLHTPAWTRRFWSSPKLQRFLQDPSRCRQQHPTHLSGIKPGVFHLDSPVFVVV